MAPVSSVAPKNATRNAITDMDIIQINNVKFSRELFRRRKHSTVAATKEVSTETRGDEDTHIHTYVVETSAQFNTQAGTNLAPTVTTGAHKYSTGVAVDLR